MNLTLSRCSVSEFTCADGNCIDATKRFHFKNQKIEEFIFKTEPSFVAGATWCRTAETSRTS